MAREADARRLLLRDRDLVPARECLRHARDAHPHGPPNPRHAPCPAGRASAHHGLCHPSNAVASAAHLLETSPAAAGRVIPWNIGRENNLATLAHRQALGATSAPIDSVLLPDANAQQERFSRRSGRIPMGKSRASDRAGARLVSRLGQSTISNQRDATFFWAASLNLDGGQARSDR